jgi:hypothetical protein
LKNEMKTEKSVGVVHRFKSVHLKRRWLDPKPILVAEKLSSLQYSCRVLFLHIATDFQGCNQEGKVPLLKTSTSRLTEH